MPCPKKMDMEKALKQKMKGMTYQEIGDLHGVAKQTVYQAIAPILKALPDAQQLSEMKKTMADHFGVTAYRAVAAITDEKLANSSARDLAIIGGISIQNQRLIDGQSTSNSSIMLKAVMASAESICSVDDDNGQDVDNT